MKLIALKSLNTKSRELENVKAMIDEHLRADIEYVKLSVQQQNTDIVNFKCLISRMDNKIEKRNTAITSLSNIVNSFNINNSASLAQYYPTQNTEINENLIDAVANEVKWRAAIQNKIRVMNATNEKEIRNTFNRIIDRQANIINITKLQYDEKAYSDSIPTFMVNLGNVNERKEILNKKGDFFRDKQFGMNIQPARTLAQRKQHKEKMEKSETKTKDKI